MPPEKFEQTITPAFLAASAAAYIIGQTIVVDGGATAW